MNRKTPKVTVKLKDMKDPRVQKAVVQVLRRYYGKKRARS